MLRRWATGGNRCGERSTRLRPRTTQRGRSIPRSCSTTSWRWRSSGPAAACSRSVARRARRRARSSSAASRWSASSLDRSSPGGRTPTWRACRSRFTSARSRRGRASSRASTSSTQPQPGTGSIRRSATRRHTGCCDAAPTWLSGTRRTPSPRTSIPSSRRSRRCTTRSARASRANGRPHGRNMFRTRWPRSRRAGSSPVSRFGATSGRRRTPPRRTSRC